MSMCASGDIFQAKVDKLIGDIEVVKAYIGDILVLIKDRFEKHIEHLRIIFDRLCSASLKVNALKCSFGCKDIIYLGSVITREGIKHNQKKVKGVMDIGKSVTTDETKEIICMVQ